MITVFTPVFNRAYIIEQLYRSLKVQTFTDFEWLIVDDGSTDNIKQLIQRFTKDNIVKIRYYYQNNGGKHRAINFGVKQASGDLFFIVDSDDYIFPNALEELNRTYQTVKDNEEFAGVSGFRCFPDGTSICKGNIFKELDCTVLDFRYKLRQRGDMAEAYKTKVLRKYPFPDIPGEKFCAESLVWNRIAQKYKLRFFYKNIYVCDYLSDGLTKSMLRHRHNSPTYAMINYSETATCNIPLKGKLKNIINYWRFYFDRNTNQKPKISKIWYPLSILGLFLNIRDSLILKKQQK